MALGEVSSLTSAWRRRFLPLVSYVASLEYDKQTALSHVRKPRACSSIYTWVRAMYTVAIGHSDYIGPLRAASNFCIMLKGTNKFDV